MYMYVVHVDLFIYMYMYMYMYIHTHTHTLSQGMNVTEKRSVDREVWLGWLVRYSHRLHQEIEEGTTLDEVQHV